MSAIRAMLDDDLPRVLDVQRQSFTPDLVERDAVILDRYARFGEDFFVALAGDIIAGYTLCFPWKLGTFPPHDELFPETLPEPDSFFIQDLSVHRDYRGRRLSKDLLKAIFARAKQRGYRQVALVAVAQSGTYWDSQGFRVLPGQSSAALAYLSSSYGEGARLMVADV